MRLASPVTRLFVQANSEEIVKLRITGPLCDRRPKDSHHKRPVMWRAFPRHDVTVLAHLMCTLFCFALHRFSDITGLILGLRRANERRRYKVTPSLIG